MGGPPDDILDLLRSLGESRGPSGGKNRKNSFDSENEAMKELDKFMAMQKPELKIGDYIVLNKATPSNYRFPGDNQVAKVYAFIEPKLNETSGDIEDMIMICALDPNTIRFYKVDSRYYRKAGKQEPDNVFKFPKKKDK